MIEKIKLVILKIDAHRFLNTGTSLLSLDEKEAYWEAKYLAEELYKKGVRI